MVRILVNMKGNDCGRAPTGSVILSLLAPHTHPIQSRCCSSVPCWAYGAKNAKLCIREEVPFVAKNETTSRLLWWSRETEIQRATIDSSFQKATWEISQFGSWSKGTSLTRHKHLFKEYWLFAKFWDLGCRILRRYFPPHLSLWTGKHTKISITTQVIPAETSTQSQLVLLQLIFQGAFVTKQVAGQDIRYQCLKAVDRNNWRQSINPRDPINPRDTPCSSAENMRKPMPRAMLYVA